MYKMQTVFALLVISVVGISSKYLEILDSPDIVISDLTSRQSKILSGIVKGARPCGGSGKLLQWRYETCKDSDNPCQVPADGSLKRTEVDFIPSKDISSLGLRLKVRSNDGEISKEFNFEDPIVNDGVQKGQPYRITNGGGVSEKLKGKRATFQYILYDKLNNEVEICAESEFQYI